MKVRRKARMVALQILYEVDLAHHPWEEVLARHLEQQELPLEAQELATSLVSGVVANHPQLDAIIGQIAPQWPCQQLAAIDRNILRMAIYEIMMASDVPLKVAINEAVELAKTFGSEGSRRFINGALGALAAQQALPEVK